MRSKIPLPPLIRIDLPRPRSALPKPRKKTERRRWKLKAVAEFIKGNL
jgi:hypothetical protein